MAVETEGVTPLLTVLRLAAAFGVLLIPTFFMGASLPLLAKGLVEGTDNAARTISVLYGVNTLGASAGAFVSVWWLIGSYGFEGTKVSTVKELGKALENAISSGKTQLVEVQIPDGIGALE